MDELLWQHTISNTPRIYISSVLLIPFYFLGKFIHTVSPMLCRPESHITWSKYELSKPASRASSGSWWWEIFDGVPTIRKPGLTIWVECLMWRIKLRITIMTSFGSTHLCVCCSFYRDVCNWRPAIAIIMNKEWSNTFHISCSNH